MVRSRLIIIALSVLPLAACGGGDDSSPTAPTPPPPSGGGVNIAISSGASSRTTDAFGTNPLNVPVGSTVVWMNNDNTSHNAIANGGAFSIGTMAPNAQGSTTFSAPGTFPYRCSIHPNMVGTIVVQ